MQDKSRLAIIPARSGSKRIPQKNIRGFLGKPIISYAIENALATGIYERVMVSTDSSEIADIAAKYGAEVPFMRSKKTSDDYAPLAEVMEEVIEGYRQTGQAFDIFTCILPTAVLLRKENLIEACNMLEDNNFDSVFPVVQFSSPILRSLKAEGKKIKMKWPEYRNTRSQDLEPAYFDAGQFYVMKTAAFIDKKALFTDNSGFIELKEFEAQDIDTPEDWELAKMKYSYIFQSHD